MPGRHSWRSSEQLGRSDEIVDGGCEGEGPADLIEAAQLGSSQAGDGLDPAERLLDPFTGAQAGGVGVPGGAAIDGRPSAAEVLGDVRSDVKGAKLVDVVGGIASGVRAPRDGAGPVGMGFDHLQRDEALGMTGHARKPGID